MNKEFLKHKSIFNTEIFKKLVDEVQIDKHNLTFKLKCGIDLEGEI